VGFGIEGLDADDLDKLYALLRRVRAASGDFPTDGS
jgi:hypothetical protein